MMPVSSHPLHLNDHPPTATGTTHVASPRSPGVSAFVLLTLDGVALVCAFLISAVTAEPTRTMALTMASALDAVVVTGIGAVPHSPIVTAIWVPLVMAPVTLLAMRLAGGYDDLVAQSRSRVLLSCVGAPLGGVGAVSLVLFSVKIGETSRVLVYSYALCSFLLLVGYRTSLRFYLRRRIRVGGYRRNWLLVGPAARLSALHQAVMALERPSLRQVVGFLVTDEEPTKAIPEGSWPIIGTVDQLGELFVHYPIHDVVFVPDGRVGWMRTAVDSCEYFRATIRIWPEALLPDLSRDGGVATHYTPRPHLVISPPGFSDDALLVKRLFDILVSATLLVLLLPVFFVTAVAIKLTTPSLPVFYPWHVIGYKGRPFTGYKFTTMVADADVRKLDLMAQNEMSGPVFKIKDDPRVTPLGRFLRKFSINELPQLWSVLKGDMSLVGPRPAGPHELRRYELWQKRKLCVQPGITCFWQVRGRNRISSFDDWVRMDFEYIDNWSLWLDVKILVRTAWTVLAGSGS